MASINNDDKTNMIKKSVISLLKYLFSSSLETNNSIMQTHIKELISALSWKYSESSCKTGSNKIGNPYWSEKAISQYLANESPVDLIHDHAIPRKLLIDWIIKNSRNCSENELQYFLGRYCFAVIITKGEDNELNKNHLKQKMPKQLADEKNYVFSLNEDPFERYKTATINYIKVNWIEDNKKWKMKIYS